MNILDNLIEIESDKSIYQYVFSYRNILMYPFIRFYLLQHAIEDIHGLSSPYDSFSIGKLQKIKYFIKSFLYKPPRYIQSDIVFFGSDVSNIIENAVYFNRLTDCFANEYLSKTILIETSDKMDYRRPRAYPRVFANDFTTIFVDKITKARSVIKPKKSIDVFQISSFLDYLKVHFNYKFSNPDIWKILENKLIQFSINIPFLHKSYLKLIKQLSPQIIMLEEACYGGNKIPIIVAAKDLNIPVGEYQHGLISLSHPAYNYSDRLSDYYKKYMPDFYMSYGNYWIKNSRIPVNVMEIGNPYLSDTVSELKRLNQIVKKEQILYISSAISPEQYVREVIQLNASLTDKGCSVIFRIHPSETERLQTVYKPIVDARIQIDRQPLYETLKDAKYLVGDFSTVLFEATLFDCVIFIRDTAYTRANLDISRFNPIQTMDEIIEKIVSKEYKQTDCEDFWADNWRSRYRELIDSYLS